MGAIEVQRKFFDLQCLVDRKAGVVLEIAQRYARDRKGEVSKDLDLHVYLFHSGSFSFFDHDRYGREYRLEMEALRHEYNEICDQITALKAELEETLGAQAIV